MLNCFAMIVTNYRMKNILFSLKQVSTYFLKFQRISILQTFHPGANSL